MNEPPGNLVSPADGGRRMTEPCSRHATAPHSRKRPLRERFRLFRWHALCTNPSGMSTLEGDRTMKQATAARWVAPDEKLDRLYQLIEDIEVAMLTTRRRDG